MRRCCAKFRLLSLLLAAVLTVTGSVSAAKPIGDGVAPTCDEAYYATLDYYGNLLESSVVKSYTRNGAVSLTDYGSYDEVINLTDGTPAAIDGDTTTFTFDPDAPEHFYFEGKTAKPYAELPFQISLSYKLNGVPVQAEALAGQQGVAEILLDILPNDGASAYARNNYTLEAVAMFNQDDILSLEAPGAQVQLVGNLRMVLFLALPGEEQHFSIRVGSNDFSFDGMTFLMVPATLAQLEDVAKIGERKDDLEENYDSLSGSLDTLLDALDGMQSSLNASAGGLDQLNDARQTFSSGKGTIYDDTDALRGSLAAISTQLAPVAQQIQDLSKTVTDSKALLNDMTDVAVSLKVQLKDLDDALDDLQEGSDSLDEILYTAAGMHDNLVKLQKALESLSGDSAAPSTGAMLQQVKALHSAYETGDRLSFLTTILTLNEDPEAAAHAQLCEQLLSAVESGTPEADVAAMAPELWPTAKRLGQLFQAKAGMDFTTFCQTLLNLEPEQAKQLNDLWELYNSGDGAMLELITGGLDNTTAQLGGALQAVTKPTAAIVGDLSEICAQLDELNDILDNASDPSAALQQASRKLRNLLTSADALRELLNDYEPTLQQTLQTVGDLSVSLAAAAANLQALLSDAESLLRSSGSQLDSGTAATLSGVADSLRQASSALDATDDLRDAKHSMSDIIEDTWDEYTGENNNLLLMDATADPVSLTDARNPAPASVQVLIRTQEIKPAEEEVPEPAEEEQPKSTVWSRIAQMFRDFWHTITGLFD